ncbi:MAG: AAA family ATPase [Verrucomicrobiota bacterium]|nr:AAA family ATPase [Verrucomicrobiota bacterium]
MLEKFFDFSRNILKVRCSSYERYFIRTTALTHQMSVIVGQRGVGKTTTLVQLLLKKASGDRFSSEILYVQADHFIMAGASLYEIAEAFQLLGGKWLAIDEIHKYPNWSMELKSIYDTFPHLQLFISGSSALAIHEGSHDLSRRALRYTMHGLSFREYLEMTHHIPLSAYSLETICKDHLKIADSILHVLGSLSKKVIPEFIDYLKSGFYPFFLELPDPILYSMTLEQNFHAIIESDLLAIHPHLTGNSIKKIKQLLQFIAGAVPFTPNWSHIGELLEVGDTRTVKLYFSYLESAHLVRGVGSASAKLAKLETPEKIYLDNTNQLFALSSASPEKGTLRETFFLSMLRCNHKITLPAKGDFLVDQKLTFEIGGKNKNWEQLKGVENSFLACDEIETGWGNKIPLWLFGFLY